MTEPMRASLPFRVSTYPHNSGDLNQEQPQGIRHNKGICFNLSVSLRASVELDISPYQSSRKEPIFGQLILV